MRKSIKTALILIAILAIVLVLAALFAGHVPALTTHEAFMSHPRNSSFDRARETNANRV